MNNNVAHTVTWRRVLAACVVLLVSFMLLYHADDIASGDLLRLQIRRGPYDGQLQTYEPSAPCIAQPPDAGSDNPAGWRIALVVVLTAEFATKHAHEVAALNCYASLHGYAMFNEPVLAGTTSSRNFFFARWALVMKHLPHYDWVLALDADTFVLDYSRPLTPFLPTSRDSRLAVILNDRDNGEVHAGAVWLRNTRYTHEFMAGWLSYDDNVPNYDNGALLMHLLSILGAPACSVSRRERYDAEFIPCFRAQLNARSTTPLTPEVYVYRLDQGFYRSYDLSFLHRVPAGIVRDYFTAAFCGDVLGMGKKQSASQLSVDELICNIDLANGYTPPRAGHIGFAPMTVRHRFICSPDVFEMFGGAGGPIDRTYNCSGNASELDTLQRP